MSIIDVKTVTCSVCGHKQKITYYSSLFGMGFSDMDGRPPQMISSAMPVWVHKCHRCGYSASFLEDGDKSLRPFLFSPLYLFCEGKPLFFPLAIRFYQQGMLFLRKNDYLSAYHAFLHASWACDDRLNLLGAISCRKKAASVFSKLQTEKQKDEHLVLTQVDLLRRTGCFSHALQLLDSTSFTEERLLPCVEYERKLIALKDRHRHSTHEIEEFRKR